MHKYRNFVRAKARSYFLIGAEREDIIQEGMIGLYKAIRDFKGDKQSSFRAFAETCILAGLHGALHRNSCKALIESQMIQIRSQIAGGESTVALCIAHQAADCAPAPNRVGLHSLKVGPQRQA